MLLGSGGGLHKAHFSFGIEMFSFYDEGVYDRLCGGLGRMGGHV